MASVKDTAASNGCTLGEEMSKALDKANDKRASAQKEWASNLNPNAKEPMNNSKINPMDNSKIKVMPPMFDKQRALGNRFYAAFK